MVAATADQKLEAKLAEIVAVSGPTRLPNYRKALSEDGRSGELRYIYASGAEKVVLSVVSD